MLWSYSLGKYQMYAVDDDNNEEGYCDIKFDYVRALIGEDKLVLKTELPVVPNDLINETTLATTLNDYALKTELPVVPNDLINEKQLTTKLSEINDKIDSLAILNIRTIL